MTCRICGQPKLKGRCPSPSHAHLEHDRAALDDKQAREDSWLPDRYEVMDTAEPWQPSWDGGMHW